MKWTYNPKTDKWTDPCGNPSSGGPESRHAKVLEGNTDQCASAWPVLSDAAGCHPDQIHEYRKFLADQGVDARYTSDGRVIMESRSHRKQVLKALNMHDRNSIDGY